MRQLLLDDDLPPRIREALTIADRSASPELSRRALVQAAVALVELLGLSIEDAVALLELPHWIARAVSPSLSVT